LQTFFSFPFSSKVDISPNTKATATRTPACITPTDAILFYIGIWWMCLNVNISCWNSCDLHPNNLPSVNEPKAITGYFSQWKLRMEQLATSQWWEIFLVVDVTSM
jgi:hypothetical protein